MGPAGGRASEQLLGQLLRSEVSISALDLASLFLGTLHMFFLMYYLPLFLRQIFHFKLLQLLPDKGIWGLLWLWSQRARGVVVTNRGG